VYSHYPRIGKLAIHFWNILHIIVGVTKWSFLTNYGRALLCIVHDPDVRLRDIATSLGITERSAYAIVSDLADAGYIVKERDGRRNRYQIQDHLPIPELPGREQAIGEVLRLLTGPGNEGGATKRRAARHRPSVN
jgi:hypothetical protein